MLRTAFKLPLRQGEGLMTSVVELLGCELAVPDHTTVSRLAIKLPSIARAALPESPLHVVIDSTGLKVYGAGQWLADRHGRRARREYRRLHLAVDADSGQIVTVMLTGQDVDDPSQVQPLLEQIPGEIGQITADGAYDGQPTYETIAARSPAIAVVIPAREGSVASAQFDDDPTQRDTPLLLIDSLGRLGWQQVSGYSRRALVETTMGRYKAIIGTRLRARDEAGRRTEAAVGAEGLNRMLAAARPNSVRSARDAS